MDADQIVEALCGCDRLRRDDAARETVVTRLERTPVVTRIPDTAFDAAARENAYVRRKWQEIRANGARKGLGK